MLSPEQMNQYSRHLSLPEVGAAGQEKLLRAKVLLIGAGGLGSPVALYLAAAGIGTLGLLDQDRVDLSNLNRQILYQAKDVGRVKVEQGKKHLNALNPGVSIRPYHEEFTGDNGAHICAGYDVVVDCLDNFHTRFILNDVCLELNIPLVHGGVHKYYGQTLTVVPSQGPCLRCIYPDEDEFKEASQDGILGVIPGIIGTLQALEVMKLLLGIGEVNKDNLLYVDGLSLSFDQIKISPREDCFCRKISD